MAAALLVARWFAMGMTVELIQFAERKNNETGQKAKTGGYFLLVVMKYFTAFKAGGLNPSRAFRGENCTSRTDHRQIITDPHLMIL